MNITVFFTKYKHNDIIFRAHPNFRGEGKWYDWAMFRYEKSEYDIQNNIDYKHTDILDEVHYLDNIANSSDYHYAPGKILGFIQLNDDNIYATTL